MDAYALTDRASWLNFANKANLRLLFEGDSKLFNQYAFLPVSGERHDQVNSQAAERLEDWLTSAKGQALIGGYEINGQQMFIPNAKPVAKSG